MRRSSRGVRVAIAAAAVTLAGIAGEAHKPITSPFTFNDDVQPIVRARCSGCHVSGGVAPMSLLTAEDAVPWAESMRVELIAGHMPPAVVDAPAERFRNISRLTARELNILLTWATGGTPPGDPARAAPPPPIDASWTLGAPDLELPVPPATIAEDVQETVVTQVVAPHLASAQWIRAVDLRPGNAAVVRSARITVRDGHHPADDERAPDRLLALWQPGDTPIAADGDAAFELPAGAELEVRVRYKKTWQYERKAMTDRSTLALYFARPAATPVTALTVADRVTLQQDTRVLAVYPDPSLSHVRVLVNATRPGGARELLLSARPRPEWARRYWYTAPVALPRGTVIDLRIDPYDESAVLPPGATAAHDPEPARAVRRVTFDVVAASR